MINKFRYQLPKPTTPYHLVTESPWPLGASIGAWGLTAGLVMWFYLQTVMFMMIPMSILLMILVFWWRDVIREATLGGYHTNKVQTGLRLGMMLFIMSEVMFFVSFFWAFFHSSLSPTPEIGCVWPPSGILPIDPFSIPLFNTALLLASGVSITWAHHELLNGNLKGAKNGIQLTLIYGIFFTLVQFMEYLEAPFTIADSIYGCTFFVATGFHGLHVIIGSSFIGVCLWRVYMNHFSMMHHFGFEAAAWYWHFVDIVWICLYLSIYWWGS